jgi:hypothetical protein
MRSSIPSTFAQALPLPSLEGAALLDRTRRNRGALPFKLLLIGMVVCTATYLRSALTRPEPASPASPFPSRINEEHYSKITTLLPEWNVQDILGDGGRTIAGPEWPAILSELPEGKGGIQLRIRLNDMEEGQLVRVSTDSKVTWKRWCDQNAPERWIAVGFVCLGEGGGMSALTVVAKRKHGF